MKNYFDLDNLSDLLEGSVISVYLFWGLYGKFAC